MTRKRLDISAITGAGYDASERRATSIANIVRNHWARMAAQQLSHVSSGSRQEYMRNLRVTAPRRRSGRATCSVILSGLLGNILERGRGPGGGGSYGPYDVRKFTLKGRPYLNIPFYRTRGDIDALAARQGMTSRQIGSRLKKLTARQTGRDHTGKIRRIAKGSALGSGFAKNQRPRPVAVRNPRTGRVMIQRPHATDPLAGMYHEQMTHTDIGGRGQANRPQSQYVVFRRMSAKGKPWVSKGFKGIDVAQKIRARLGSIIASTSGVL